MVLLHQIAVQSFLDFLPAHMNPLEVLLLSFVLLAGVERGVGTANSVHLFQMNLEGLLLHVDVSYFVSTLRIKH